MVVGKTALHYEPDFAASSVHMSASGMTMSYLADLLMRSGVGGERSVVDMTGLKGAYEVVIDLPMPTFGTTRTIDAGTSDADTSGTSLAAAASDPGGETIARRSLKKLGLDLENRRAEVQQLVVDNAERMPTEN